MRAERLLPRPTAPTRPTTTTGSTTKPRPALPRTGGLRHRGRPKESGRVHERRLGTGRRHHRGKTHPARTGCEGSLAHLAQPVPGNCHCIDGARAAARRGERAHVARRVHAEHLVARGSAPLRRALRPRHQSPWPRRWALPPRKGGCACSRRINRGEVSAAPPRAHADRTCPRWMRSVVARAHQPAAATGGLVPPQSVGEWLILLVLIRHRTAAHPHQHRGGRRGACRSHRDRALHRGAAKTGGGGRSRAPGQLLAGSR